MNSAYNDIYLGKGCRYSTNPVVTGLNNNLAVVGGSGSGKTMSVMEMKFLLNQGKSIIASVSKKNLLLKYIPYFYEKGFEVLYLDLADPEKGNVSFDPLHYIHGINDTVGAQNLAGSVVRSKKEDTTNQGYWETSAIHLLLSEIFYVLTRNRRATLRDVLNFHDDLLILDNESGRGIKTNHDGDYDLLTSNNPALRYWNTFRQTAEGTARSIYSSLNAPLHSFFPLEYQRSLNTKPQVNLLHLAAKPTVLFIYTSPVNKEMHALSNMFMSYAIKELYEYAEKRPNGKLPIPVELMFDDFACGCPIDRFPEFISIFREKGMSTTIMLQSETQLESLVSEADARIILDNCDTYLYMGGMNADNAYSMARRCGVPEEKILNLPVGQEVILRRGQKPVFAERYDITNNLEYQKIENKYQQMIRRKEKLRNDKCI